MDVRFSSPHILVDGSPGLLVGGEFQYFRIPSDLWRPSLTRLRQAGLNLITSYIPWIWHEIEEGTFDFTGESRPERSLLAFLDLCRELGFAVTVKPGPYIYAEYDGFGLPHWLRRQYPETLMVTDKGQLDTEVSLNHPTFLDKVERWLKAVYPVIRPYLDQGVVIAWQIDNETGLPQYGRRVSVSDFNEHTVARFRAWLRERHHSLEAVQDIWQMKLVDWTEVRPPERGKATVAQMWQWAAFVEDDIVTYLATIKQKVVQLGVDCFLYTNDPCATQWPNQAAKKNHQLPVAFDIYTKFTTSPVIHDFPFMNSYIPELFQGLLKQGVLMGAEVGCGWFDPRVQVKPEATQQLAMSCFLRGTQYLSWYIIQDCVEVDGTPWRWNAALDHEGHPTERLGVVERVAEFVQRGGRILASSTPIKSPVAIANYLPQARIALKPGFNLGGLLELEGTGMLTHFTGPSSLFGVLAEAGYNPHVVAIDQVSDEQLAEQRVIYLFSAGVMDRDTYQKLVRYVESGGVLITMGQPVVRDLDNQKLEETPLHPAHPKGPLNHVHFGNRTIMSRLVLDLVDYQMKRRKVQHQMSLHTLDMMQPFAEVIKYIGKVGTWLNTDRGQPLWVSRFTSAWYGGGVTPFLKHNGMAVGYSARLGAGRTIFIGSLPGIFYDSPAYYTKEANKRESVIHFFSHMLQEMGIMPLTQPLPQVEVILRRFAGGLLVALINRGEGQGFNLELDHLGHFQALKPLFAHASWADLDVSGALTGHLAAHDVLVVALTP